MIDIYPESGSTPVHITGGYGELYIADNVVTQTLTPQNSFVKWVNGWTVGEFNQTTPSVANSNIVIGTAGVYMVSCSMSLAVTGNNQTLEVAIFRNGAYQPDHSLHAVFATGDIVPFTLIGILTLGINDTIDVRVQNTTSAGKVLTISDANLSCHQI